MIFRKTVFTNVLITIVASLLAAVAVRYLGGGEAALFWRWLRQAVGVVLFGLVLQNLFHLYWLQGEYLLTEGDPGELEDPVVQRALGAMLAFPLRAVFLSATLWIVLAVPAAYLYARTASADAADATMVYLLLSAIGVLSALTQVYFYRRMLYAHLEAYLERLGEAGLAWLWSRPMPFTIQGKLVLQSAVGLLVVLFVAMAVGYGAHRAVVQRQLHEALAAGLSLAELGLGGVEEPRTAEVEELLRQASSLFDGAIVVEETRTGQRFYGIAAGGDEAARLREVLGFVLDGKPYDRAAFMGLRREAAGWRLAAVVPWNGFAGALGRFLGSFLVALGTGWFLIFGISILASHDLSRGIRRAERWVKELGMGALVPPPTLTEDDDTGDLTVRLEALRTRLRQLLARMAAGAAASRHLSGRIQDHALYLRQTTNEDHKLLQLTRRRLERLRRILERELGIVDEAQGTVGSLLEEANAFGSWAGRIDDRARDLEQRIRLYGERIRQGAAVLELTRELQEALGAQLQAVRSEYDRLEGVVDELLDGLRQLRHAMAAVVDHAGRVVAMDRHTERELGRLIAAVERAGELLEGLDATMARLDEVAAAIHEVAEDTKLLSLNAAIRSARADEYGRGFAVISATIQELADETQGTVGHLQEEVQRLREHGTTVASGVAALVERFAAFREALVAGAAAWEEVFASFDGVRAFEQHFGELVRQLESFHQGLQRRLARFERDGRHIVGLLERLRGEFQRGMSELELLEADTGKVVQGAGFQSTRAARTLEQLDEVQRMTRHLRGALLHVLRALAELAQGFDQLDQSAAANVDEAVEIATRLRELDRALLAFQDAFERFRLEEEGT